MNNKTNPAPAGITVATGLKAGRAGDANDIIIAESKGSSYR